MEDFVVRKVGSEYGSDRTFYICELEGLKGRRVSFMLMLREEPGRSDAPEQYVAVSSHLRVGMIISCKLAYTFEYKSLIAGIVSFYEIQPKTTPDGPPLTGDQYLALGENPLVISGRFGPVVLVPGRIPLLGDACLPVFGQERVEHTRIYEQPHRSGLRWGRRPSWLRRWWWNQLAKRRGFTVGYA